MKTEKSTITRYPRALNTRTQPWEVGLTNRRPLRSPKTYVFETNDPKSKFSTLKEYKRTSIIHLLARPDQDSGGPRGYAYR